MYFVSNAFLVRRINRLLFSNDKDRIENNGANNSSNVVRICCCRNVFTESLNNNGRGFTYRFMKCAVEMGSGTIYT
jgi:hypothetical protein